MYALLGVVTGLIFYGPTWFIIIWTCRTKFPSTRLDFSRKPVPRLGDPQVLSETSILVESDWSQRLQRVFILLRHRVIASVQILDDPLLGSVLVPSNPLRHVYARWQMTQDGGSTRKLIFGTVLSSWPVAFSGLGPPPFAFVNVEAQPKIQ